jgi:hypothetical protein
MKTRLENVIEQVKAARTGVNRPWIFTEDGKIADNIMCGEVLDVLEELKGYEISVSDEWIENFKSNPKVKGDNTYNYNANISNDLNMDYLENDDGEVIMLIMVHLYGDIRCGYSDYFAVRFDSMYEFYELESAIQVKDVNEHMVADLNIFSETYNVYDYEKQEDVGDFYELELADLLEEIKNQGKD